MRLTVTNEMTGVRTEIYPVGVLETIQHVKRTWTKPGLDKRWARTKTAVRRQGRFIGHYLKRREWRVVADSFNGYLAEHPTCRHNAGHGWSTGVAYRRVEEICRKATWDQTTDDVPRVVGVKVYEQPDSGA